MADPCRVRVKGFRKALFRDSLHGHFVSTVEMPELKEFKPEAKFICVNSPQTNYSVIFPSPQLAARPIRTRGCG